MSSTGTRGSALMIQSLTSTVASWSKPHFETDGVAMRGPTFSIVLSKVFRASSPAILQSGDNPGASRDR